MRHAVLVAMRERGDELLKERPREFLGELLGEDKRKRWTTVCVTVCDSVCELRYVRPQCELFVSYGTSGLSVKYFIPSLKMRLATP